MGLFDLFKKSEKVPEIKRKSGSHGSHWDCVMIVGEKGENLQNIVMETVQSGKVVESAKIGEKNVVVVAKNYGNALSFVVPVNGSIWTAFPYVNSTTKYDSIIQSVEIWTNGIEAQISAKFFNAILSFFAIDYISNIEKYNQGEKLKIELSAIDYAVQVGGFNKEQVKNNEGKSFQMSPDFVGIFPTQYGVDDYNFYGKVEKIEKIELFGKEGYKIKTKIIDSGDWKLSIDLNVLSNKINGQIPKQNDTINGMIWLTGKICK